MKYSEYRKNVNAINTMNCSHELKELYRVTLDEQFEKTVLKKERDIHATVAVQHVVEQAKSNFVRLRKNDKQTESKSLASAMQTYASKSTSSARALFVRLCAQRLTNAEIANHQDVLAFYDHDHDKIARRVKSQCNAIRKHLLHIEV